MYKKVQRLAGLTARVSELLEALERMEAAEEVEAAEVAEAAEGAEAAGAAKAAPAAKEEEDDVDGEVKPPSRGRLVSVPEQIEPSLPNIRRRLACSAPPLIGSGLPNMAGDREWR